MENGGERKKVTGRETSPDLSKLSSSNPNHQQQIQQRLTKSIRKAKIIYYLSRNGKLEHPHFMELLYLPHQQLRLKDVIDRLTILRGKGLHSLFSWSCKRSYKSGYVWNDLDEHDVIYPADGIEFILKGSEIIPAFSGEKLHHLRPSIRQAKAMPVSRITSQLSDEEGEIRENRTSPLPLSSSDKLPTTVSGEVSGEVSGPGWNSVLLQIVSCGSRATKGRSCAASGAMIKAAAAVVASPLSGRMSSHRRVVSRAANRASEQDELLCDSEDPAFRCAPVEDKEYFTGSISGGPPQPSLEKSSSYNEERSSKLGIGEAKMGETEQDETRELGEMKAKCIPGRRRASAKQRQQQ